MWISEFAHFYTVVRVGVGRHTLVGDWRVALGFLTLFYLVRSAQSFRHRFGASIDSIRAQGTGPIRHLARVMMVGFTHFRILYSNHPFLGVILVLVL